MIQTFFDPFTIIQYHNVIGQPFDIHQKLLLPFNQSKIIKNYYLQEEMVTYYKNKCSCMFISYPINASSIFGFFFFFFVCVRVFAFQFFPSCF